ncbi:hypothetical protein [Luteolibacter sp. Populi]|uniref:hypothetical protein n=1 Tax=Luteolibacter sp. Populi TaxID=3230487 RepID=UPI0034655247
MDRSNPSSGMKERDHTLLPPAPKVGFQPLLLEEVDGGLVVTAKAPGFFRLPKALAVLGLGLFFSGIGLYVVYGAFLIVKREPGIVSILCALIPLLCAWLFLWLGRTGLGWALAATLGTTKVSLKPGLIVVERSGLFGSRAQVPAKNYSFLTITDEFKLILELIVSTKDHRVVLVLNGRSKEELDWLADLIETSLVIKKRRSRNKIIKSDPED